VLSSHLIRHFSPSQRTRRRGVALTYFALFFAVAMGLCAFVVDLGADYVKKSDLQRAADASALAGAASLLRNSSDISGATTASRAYAATYGFINGTGGVAVQTGVPPAQPDRYRVTITQPQPSFFARFFGRGDLNIRASGTASFTTFGRGKFVNDGTIASLQAAFVNNGPYALGPQPDPPNGINSFGDRFSPLFKNNGTETNPFYDPKGTNFKINVPPEYFSPGQGRGSLLVEIFDADTGGALDEIHSAAPPLQSRVSNDANTTDYSVIYTDPVTGVEEVVDSFTWRPGMDGAANYDNKWAQDLQIPLNNARYAQQGALSLRVKASDGASENGFYIRTGPPHAASMTDAEWKQAYGPAAGVANGTSFEADGRVSLNFFKSGTTVIDMGNVGAEQAGKKITVTGYDLEGGNDLKIISDTPFEGYPPGGYDYTQLPGNGVFRSWDVTLPPSYSGGRWRVEYSAGQNDSSSWQLAVPGNNSGTLRLVE